MILLVFSQVYYCLYNIEEVFENLLSFVAFLTALKLLVTSKRKYFISEETTHAQILFQALRLSSQHLKSFFPLFHHTA